MRSSATANSEPIKTVYYTDELGDDFVTVTRNHLEIDGTYRYQRKKIPWVFLEWLVYRVIMTPFAFLYSKWKYGYRIENHHLLRQAKNEGYFVYGNHVLMDGDAFLPSMVCFPKKTKVVVHADNLSHPTPIRRWIELCGAIPVPTKHSGMRPFLNALGENIGQGHAIQIYPEAHVWHFYTGIRPFDAASFRYPLRFHAPVFCATTTFQKSKHGKTPKVTVYVDGPFYADESLTTERAQAQQLRDVVYNTMVERAKNSTYEAIRYVKSDSGKENP